MSVVGFDVQFLINGTDGEAELHRIATAFERAGSEVGNFEKHLWPAVQEAFETDERRQFAEEGGGPARGSWAELSPEYAKWKALHYPGKPILQATGTMMRALTDANSEYALRVTTNDTFEFGTMGLEYPSFHQLGTGNMPDRPPFDPGSDFESDLAHAGAAAVRKAVEEARLDEFVEVVD